MRSLLYEVSGANESKINYQNTRLRNESATSSSTADRSRGAEAYDAGTDSFVLACSLGKIGRSVERFINVAYLTTFDA